MDLTATIIPAEELNEGDTFGLITPHLSDSELLELDPSTWTVDNYPHSSVYRIERIRNTHPRTAPTMSISGLIVHAHPNANQAAGECNGTRHNFPYMGRRRMVTVFRTPDITPDELEAIIVAVAPNSAMAEAVTRKPLTQERGISNLSQPSLDPRFTPFYREQGSKPTRVAVIIHGEIHLGHIGKTTGSSPVYLLMHSRQSHGSVNVLNQTTTIVAKKGPHDRNYLDGGGNPICFKSDSEGSLGAVKADRTYWPISVGTVSYPKCNPAHPTTKYPEPIDPFEGLT